MKERKEGGKRTLDLGDVEEASRVADHASTGEGQLRNRLEATLVKSASTVSDALASFEDVGEERVVFEALWRGKGKLGWDEAKRKQERT